MIPEHSKASWVPSVYYVEGLPYALVCGAAPILYKDFQFNNSLIALFTSLFMLPWILKFLVAPFLENYNKKYLLYSMQITIAIITLLLAFSLYLQQWFYCSIVILFLIGTCAALHDINADGLYLEVLTTKDQAKFIGIRTAFYQLGKLVGQGALIYVIGLLLTPENKIQIWSNALIVLSLSTFLIAGITIYTTAPIRLAKPLTLNTAAYLKNIKQLPYLFVMLIFIVCYNFSAAQIDRIFPLFLLDKHVAISTIGIINAISIVSLLFGVTVAGFILARNSLKTCLLPFTLITTFANVIYLSLSYSLTLPMWQLVPFISLAQFSYGLSNAAYMLSLVNYFSNRPYSMSLYAYGTALMLFGMMLAGTLSGYLQEYLGYHGFFLWTFLLGLPISTLTFYIAKQL